MLQTVGAGSPPLGDPSVRFQTPAFGVGTTIGGTVDGNSDGFILDAHDGWLQYRVDPLP